MEAGQPGVRAGQLLLLALADAVFFGCGLVFFRTQIFRDYEIKRRLVPILFALTLSFSCCLPLLVILEIAGGLTRPARLAGLRAHLLAILLLILWVLPTYSIYLCLAESLGLGRRLGRRAGPLLTLAAVLLHANLYAALARLTEGAQLVADSRAPPLPSLAAGARTLGAAALATLGRGGDGGGADGPLAAEARAVALAAGLAVVEAWRGRCTALVGMAGVALVAAISGSGAVAWGYATGRRLLRPVGWHDVSSLEKRLLQTVEALAAKRRRLALLRSQRARLLALGGGGGGGGSSHAEAAGCAVGSAGGAGAAAAAAAERKAAAAARARELRATLAGAEEEGGRLGGRVGGLLGALRGWLGGNGRGSGGRRDGASGGASANGQERLSAPARALGARIADEEAESGTLAEMGRSMFLDLVEARSERERLIFQSSGAGRAMAAFAYAFTAFCVLRIGISAANVLGGWHARPKVDAVTRIARVGARLQQLGARVAGGGMGGGGGGGAEGAGVSGADGGGSAAAAAASASAAAAAAAAKGATALESLSQGLSFAFVAVIAVTSVRGALMALRRAFVSSASSSSSASQLSLMLAALLGSYFVASLLLLRNALPERYRPLVTEALGGSLAFPLFHLWFDLIFLGSAALAAIAVGAHVLANEAHGHGGGGGAGGGGFGGGGLAGAGVGLLGAGGGLEGSGSPHPLAPSRKDR